MLPQALLSGSKNMRRSAVALNSAIGVDNEISLLMLQLRGLNVQNDLSRLFMNPRFHGSGDLSWGHPQPAVKVIQMRKA